MEASRAATARVSGRAAGASLVVQGRAAMPRLPVSPGNVLALQGTLGNGAVQRILASQAHAEARPPSLVGATPGSAAQHAPANRTGLPDALKAGVEALSGYSMDDVRVHRNSNAPAQLQAHAFAQGTDIHVAPGQEKHLPHEAWHVVQQKQGRVNATERLESGVPVNDDAGLEREADVMGAAAMRPSSPIAVAATDGRPAPFGLAAAPVQRKSARQAGYVKDYSTAARDGVLYNINPRRSPKNGSIYVRTLEQAQSTAAVLDTYMASTRELGQALQEETFLDKWTPHYNAFTKDSLPKKKKDSVVTLMKYMKAPNDWGDGLDNDTLVKLSTALAGNRDELRNNANIGLIDPFITRVCIPHEGKNDWILETNFSEAALGYITWISVGSTNLTGRITADEHTFKQIATTIPADGGDYSYSPVHDTKAASTVEKQIGAIAKGASNKNNAPGFDAITKLAGEGTRFQPIRELGMALTVNSRFYAFDKSAGVMRFLTFLDLYRNWGTWFSRAYGIDAAAVRNVVLRKDQQLNEIDPEHDYDLDFEAPVSVVESRISEIRERIKNEQALDENDRDHAKIKAAMDDLAPYRERYPHLAEE